MMLCTVHVTNAYHVQYYYYYAYGKGGGDWPPLGVATNTSPSQGCIQDFFWREGWGDFLHGAHKNFTLKYTFHIEILAYTSLPPPTPWTVIQHHTSSNRCNTCSPLDVANSCVSSCTIPNCQKYIFYSIEFISNSMTLCFVATQFL